MPKIQLTQIINQTNQLKLLIFKKQICAMFEKIQTKIKLAEKQISDTFQLIQKANQFINCT